MARDQRAPDGAFSRGLRLVRKGGRVKAGGMWFQGDCLLPLVGKFVILDNFDYWQTGCQAYREGDGTVIGDLK